MMYMFKFVFCMLNMVYLYRHTGNKTKCLNLGSYNYLGFAENTGPCADAAYQSTIHYGPGTASPARELGTVCVCLCVCVCVCERVCTK